MNSPRILLVGYYGKGNFGDDVLLCVTHGIVKRAFPEAAISVIVDGTQGSYVEAMLGEVTLLAPGRHGHFDLIVHGGGGVYFDFTAHGIVDRVTEALMCLVGLRSYVALEKFARILTGKSRTSTAARLGFGIGVGTYTPGSPRLRAALPIIADYDALWVRDAVSTANLVRFEDALTASIIEGSDLAFLTEHWMPPGKREQAPGARPRLGIILRDWEDTRGGTAPTDVQAILAQLAATYDITGFIFDQHTDPQTVQLFVPYATFIWQPETMTINAFAEQLAAQDVVLTSRAHGAICAACLGVPSVIVAIEPKLEQVAAMLPNATVTVHPQRTQDWLPALEKAGAISKATIAADVEYNRGKSQAALERMRQWLV